MDVIEYLGAGGVLVILFLLWAHWFGPIFHEGSQGTFEGGLDKWQVHDEIEKRKQRKRRKK